MVRSVFVFVLLLTFTAAPGAQAPKLSVPHTQFTLPNGLNVILHRDTSVPVVAVNLWYHVGSGHERPGRTGFAHLFEHVMFEGSTHVPEGSFDTWLEAAGANNNGSTSVDRTNYYIDLPSNALDLALFLESDRMGFLLDDKAPDKINGQRDVVKNEKRQGVDNQPYGQAFRELPAMLYPAGHPYSWSTIGSMEDLSAASFEDVARFFRTYYVPNNASLVIAGDIDIDATRKLVEKWFSEIPRGKPVPALAPPSPVLDGVKRKTITDRVQLPRLYMGWHTPAHLKPGDATLDIAANLLSGGKNSRLYRRLVYDMQIAQDVNAFQQSQALGSNFFIVATARPGESLDKLQAVIDEELDQLRSTAPEPREMTRALNQVEANFYRAMERVGGFGGKADQLNAYYKAAGTPDYFAKDLGRYQAVTAADVSAAVEQVKPDRAKPPAIGPAPALKLPAIQKHKLSNGLNVWIVEHHEVPLAQINLIVRSGSAADPIGKFGVGNLAAAMLDEGAGTRSALDLADALEFLGANLSTTSSFDYSAIRMSVPVSKLADALPLVADVTLRPTFPASDLDRLRKERLTGLLQARDNPAALIQLAFPRVVFGPTHRYGTSANGLPAALEAFTVADLQSFYRAHYRPDNTTILVVGDVTPETVVPMLEKQFGAWKSDGLSALVAEVPTAPQLKSRQIYIVDKPEAVQSQIRIGWVGVARSTADYAALEVLNTILGGSFTSRLNQNLRANNGYSYGASSSFDMRLSAGPFLTAAGVQTDKTGPAVAEFFNELNAILT